MEGNKFSTLEIIYQRLIITGDAEHEEKAWGKFYCSNFLITFSNKQWGRFLRTWCVMRKVQCC